MRFLTAPRLWCLLCPVIGWIALLTAGCAGSGTSTGPTPASFSPACDVLCPDFRPFARGSTMGTTRAAVWEKGSPIPVVRNTASWSNLASRTPTITSGRDVDQIWIRGADIPGYNEIYRVDVGERVGVNETAQLIFTRQTFSGTWTGQTRINAGIGLTERVSLASVNQELQVCTVAQGGRLWHNSRPTSPSGLPEFRSWFDVEQGDNAPPPPGPAPPLSPPTIDKKVTGAGEIGALLDVACAGVVNPSTNTQELHICAVTDDGRIWHAVASDFDSASRGIFTSWTTFGDVESQIGDLGDLVRVDCAENGSQLHLVAVARRNGGYTAWHTIRGASGAFTPPTDVIGAASVLSIVGEMTDVGIGFCNEGVPPDAPSDVSQLNIVIAINDGLVHTIRSAQPVLWTPIGSPSHWAPLIDLDQATNGSSLTLRNVGVSERPYAP